MKLPKGVEEAFDEFDAAAQSWGWDSDQARAEDAAESQKRYDKAKAALFNEITKMRRNDRRRRG